MSEIDGKILQRLEEWKEKAEVPPELVEFYRRLLRIQSRAERRVGTPVLGLSSEAISQRLERGLPLIRFAELDLDWSLLKNIFAEVTATFADYPDLFGEFPKSLRERKSHPSLPKKVARAWFKSTKLPSTIEVDGVNEYLLLEAIIHATFRPFLVSHSKALVSLVDQERWRRDYCPICGGRPDFAFLDKEHGARWLLCSRCDTEWLFKRLQCPFCGNQNQDTLAYLTDDEGVYRLYVCEQCKQYLKTIDLRQAKEEIEIPLERLFTLGIDMQAQEYGYDGSKPGTNMNGGKDITNS